MTLQSIGNILVPVRYITWLIDWLVCLSTVYQRSFLI